ncbi:hypothetical protein [Spirochaeta africana]|nr:hypothetical protein [Spirochaeta africana]
MNSTNERAIAFYTRNGFTQAYQGSMKHRGQYYSELLMLRSTESSEG